MSLLPSVSCIAINFSICNTLGPSVGLAKRGRQGENHHPLLCLGTTLIPKQQSARSGWKGEGLASQLLLFPAQCIAPSCMTLVAYVKVVNDATYVLYLRKMFHLGG